MEYGIASVLERRPDETVKQWQVRLILEKLVHGLDIDWFEMSKLDGFDCTPDHLRRVGKGVELVFEAGMLSAAPIVPASDASELEAVRIEKQKIWDLRREVNEHYRASARDELLRETVLAAVRELPPIRIDEEHQIAHNATCLCDPVLVVPVADIHYGREITVSGLRGETLNVYSPEIFERRMNELYRQIVEMLRYNVYSRLIIPNLGDTLDGILRVGQLTSLRFGVVDSCIRVSEYLAHWLNRLSEHIPLTYINLLGNHDEVRPLGSKRGDFPRENFGRIIGWWIEERLRGNDRVSVRNGNAAELIDIQGSNVLLIHGDADRKPGEAAKEYAFLYGCPIDYVLRGHLHSFSEQVVGVNDKGYDIEEIQVPSICGVDDFAMSLKRRASAGAVALTFERDTGKTSTKLLKLE